MRVDVQQAGKAYQAGNGREKAGRRSDTGTGFQDLVFQITSMMHASGEPLGQGNISISQNAAEENQGISAVDGNPSGYVNVEALEETVRQAGALNRMQLIEEAITESKSPAFSLEWVYPQADAELRDAAALAEGDPGGRLLAAGPNAQAQDTGHQNIMALQPDIGAAGSIGSGEAENQNSINAQSIPEAITDAPLNGYELPGSENTGGVMNLDMQAIMKTEAFQGKDAADGTGTLKSMPGPGETAPETNEPEMLLSSRALMKEKAEAAIADAEAEPGRPDMPVRKAETDTTDVSLQAADKAGKAASDEQVSCGFKSPAPAENDTSLYGKALAQDNRPPDKQAAVSADRPRAEEEILKSGQAAEEADHIPAMQDRVSLQGSLDSSQASGPELTFIQNMQDIELRIAKEFMLLKTENESSLRMKLIPEHLGEMEIRLRMKDGLLTAEILVETMSAKEAMESQLQYLKSRLKSQNIILNEVSIGLHQGSQEAGQKKNRGFYQEGSRYHLSGQVKRHSITEQHINTRARPGWFTGTSGYTLDVLA
ncbi:MAG: flagellar hook-length control protein FliK [Clostridiales bacterium]|nr:flagellar hook-length control protein FliK [Clostridiales bacterium]